MQLGQRQFVTKRNLDQIDFPKERPRLCNRRALAQNPWDKFELRDIILSLALVHIRRVADKIQPRHAKPLFIHRVVI